MRSGLINFKTWTFSSIFIRCNFGCTN